MKSTHAGAFAVAFAIALLALALWRVADDLPELNRHLASLSTTGERVAEQVPGALDTANRYEPHIAPLLAEVTASRELAQQALTESAAWRENLPAMLARLESLETRLAALQQQLPEVLGRVDGALEESRAWRPLTGETLKEAEAWRAVIPDYLRRSENLVASAREAGKEASSGMVSGFVSGTLALPFQALGNVGSLLDPRSLSAKHLTREDREQLRNAAIALLQDPARKLAEWSSSSGHSGSVEVIASEGDADRRCHTLTFNNRFRDGKSENLKRKLCLDSDGEWQITK